MTGQWFRSAFVTAACASMALLAGCGSSSVVSQLKPARIVGFGDAFSDQGSGGVGKYTVNDGSSDNWLQQVGGNYGLSLASTADGGTIYSRGNARITSAVDAAGGSAPSVTQQITNFLAASSIGANDLFVLNGGFSDIIAETAAVNAGTQTSDAMLANVGQAGRELGAQVRRLVTAGAKYVVVVGPYNLGRSPWATSIGRNELIGQAASKFNDELLISITDLGAKVLYVDLAFYYNLVLSSPTNYSFNDAANPVCNSVDAGPGIGTGAGKVNSSQCNTGTVINGDYNKYVFADAVYTTPAAQRTFGDYAYNRIHDRF